MEEEVGMEFVKLMSYKDGWGYIVVDGFLVNLEGFWYVCNIKLLLFVMKEVIFELVVGKSDWELMNLLIEEIMNLLDSVLEKIDEIKVYLVCSGKYLEKLGKWLVL